MQKGSGIESFIKAIYRKYRSDFSAPFKEHPDEETFACFLEGLLPQEQCEFVKKHLIGCSQCGDSFAMQLKFNESREVKVPQELIKTVKGLTASINSLSILEIFLRCRENFCELLNTNGDISTGRGLIAASLLRSGKMPGSREGLTVLKDFEKIKVEVKIENNGISAFNLTVIVKEKKTGRFIKDLRATLLKDNLELESYLFDSGKVIFEQVVLGNYLVEISDAHNKLAVISLNIKT